MYGILLQLILRRSGIKVNVCVYKYIHTHICIYNLFQVEKDYMCLMNKLFSVLNFCFVSGSTSSHASAGEERRGLKEKLLHLKYVRTCI